jgi:hypothetical protein
MNSFDLAARGFDMAVRIDTVTAVHDCITTAQFTPAIYDKRVLQTAYLQSFQPRMFDIFHS